MLTQGRFSKSRPAHLCRPIAFALVLALLVMTAPLAAWAADHVAPSGKMIRDDFISGGGAFVGAGTHVLFGAAGQVAVGTSQVPPAGGLVNHGWPTLDKAPPTAFTPTANPPSWTNANTVSISYLTTDLGSGISRYEVAVDAGGYTTQTSPFALDVSGLSDGMHTVHVKAIDGSGNARIEDVTIYLDKTLPTVDSITRVNPSPTNSGGVDFLVTFSEDMFGGGTGNFSLTTTGTIAGASIMGVAGTGATRTVTVSTGTGDGTIRLDVVNNGGWGDQAANGVGGLPYVAGALYDIDKTRPTVTISAPSAPATNTGPVTYTVTYADTGGSGVAGVTLSGADVMVTQTGTAAGTKSVIAGNPTSTVTISSVTGTGTLGISLAAGTASDLAGNTALAAGPSGTFVVDNLPPASFSVVADPSWWTNANTISISFSTTDSGSGMSHYEVAVDAGGYTTQTSPYMLDVSALPDGQHTVHVQAFDNAGNVRATNRAIYCDKTAPVAFTPTAVPPSWTNANTISILFSTTDAASSVSRYELAVGAGGYAPRTSPYALDVSGLPDGQHTVHVRAFDDAGNGTGPQDVTIYRDTLSPTVAMTSTAPDPTDVAPIPVTVTFNEPVTGFGLLDIAVSNGSAQNLQGSGAGYTFDLVPATLGLVTADIGPGVCVDLAGNPNAAAVQFHRQFVSLRPTVNISSTVSDPTNQSPIPVTITFSASVADFVETDLEITNGASQNFTGSGTTYAFDLIPGGQGTLMVTVPDNVAHDSGAHGNWASTFTIGYDNVAPEVTLTSPAPNSTYVGTIPVTVTFGEPVTGLIGTAIVTVNAAVANFLGAGASYSFDLVVTGPGPVTAQIPAGAAQDVAGNGNASGEISRQCYNHLSIAVPPEGGTKPEGDSHTFQVIAAGGIPPLSYQWKKNDFPIPGATDASYTIDPLAQSDTGVYAVEVSDASADVLAPEAVVLTVELTGLPVAGVAGIAFLLALMAAGGAARMRKK